LTSVCTPDGPLPLQRGHMKEYTSTLKLAAKASDAALARLEFNPYPPCQPYKLAQHIFNGRLYKPQSQQTGSHLSSSRPNCLRRLFLRFLSLHRDQKHPNIARSQPIRTPSTTGPPALASSSLCEINKKTEVGCVRK